jgi:hypothetical protein
VWVEVPTQTWAAADQDGGRERRGRRGPYPVDQLAIRWGSRPTEEGKAVWFEMLIKPQAAGILSGSTSPESR